jgi:hypothetical protein
MKYKRRKKRKKEEKKKQEKKRGVLSRELKRKSRSTRH